MLGILTRFAQDTSTDVLIVSDPTDKISIGSFSFHMAMGMFIFMVIIYFAVVILLIASMWKVFVKAKQPGWAAIIPIYNVLVLLRVANRPWWWIFGYIIPFVSIIVAIVVYYDVAKAFGRGVGMLLLMIFIPIIGWPILGFGSDKYRKIAHA
jgi:hypothetical protein